MAWSGKRAAPSGDWLAEAHSRFIESGRHDELIKEDGLYAELHHLQFDTEGSIETR